MTTWRAQTVLFLFLIVLALAATKVGLEFTRSHRQDTDKQSWQTVPVRLLHLHRRQTAPWRAATSDSWIHLDAGSDPAPSATDAPAPPLLAEHRSSTAPRAPPTVEAAATLTTHATPVPREAGQQTAAAAPASTPAGATPGTSTILSSSGASPSPQSAPADEDAARRGAEQPEQPESDATGVLPEFEGNNWVALEERVFRRFCGGWDAELRDVYKPQYDKLDGKILIWDVSFKWLGLGNSYPWWRGLFKLAFSSGRIPIMLFNKCEEAPQDETAQCNFDMGRFFMARHGLDWQYNPRTRRRIAEALQRRNDSVWHVQYRCHKTAHDVLPEYRGNHYCRIPVVLHPDGTNTTWENVPRDPSNKCTTECGQMFDFLQSAALQGRRVVRVTLQGFDQLQEYYDDPRLTSWPRGTSSNCFMNGLYFPKPGLQQALLPTMRRLHDKRSVVAIHFRLGYVDWVQRVSPEVLHANTPRPEQESWDAVERALRQCTKDADGRVAMPCMRWNSFDRGYGGKNKEEAVRKTTPTLAYALQSHRCQANTSANQFRLSHDNGGTVGAMFTCAARIAEAVSRNAVNVSLLDTSRVRVNENAPNGSWALFLMSDTPLIQKLAFTDAALAPHVVVTPGVVGHLDQGCRGSKCVGASSAARASASDAWTRTAMDYYVARLANCMLRVVWSSWGNAIIDQAILPSTGLCPWWYAEESFNQQSSRYTPPDDPTLPPLLAGSLIADSDLIAS